MSEPTMELAEAIALTQEWSGSEENPSMPPYRKALCVLLAAAEAWEAVRVHGWDVESYAPDDFVCQTGDRRDIIGTGPTPLSAVRAAINSSAENAR